jgi:hypothetical protein
MSVENIIRKYMMHFENKIKKYIIKETKQI